MTEPDEALLWARERAKERFSSPVYINICAQIDAGDWDDDLTYSAQAYLAGARMAREQERERADMPIGMAEALVDRCQRLLHSLPAGVHAQLDVKWGLVALCRAVEAEIAKYRGEA